MSSEKIMRTGEELKVGDIVMHYYVSPNSNCPDCECECLFKIFKIITIGPARNGIMCRKGIIHNHENVAYNSEGAYFPISWLASYSHFKNWYEDEPY